MRNPVFIVKWVFWIPDQARDDTENGTL